MRRIFLRPTGGLRAGWRFLLFVAALFAAGLVLSAAVRLLALPPLSTEDGFVRPGSLFARGALGLGLTLGVTALFVCLLEKRPLATVGLPLRGPWWKGLAIGLALGAAPVVSLVALLAATGNASVSLALPGPVELLRSWLPMTAGLALVSSQEELLLRGYGLQTLADGAGRWFAALFTGALFGLMHAGNPGANALGIANTAVNAVLLAWLVLRTGSLWMAFAYHASWNITGAMVFGLRLSGMDHVSGLLATHLTGPDWMSGGSYGFEGSALIGLLEFAVLSAAVGLAPRFPRHPESLRYFGTRTAPREHG